MCVCVGTSVELQDLETMPLPDGLVVETFTPYDMLPELPLGIISLP